MDLKSLFPGVVERSWHVGGLQICLRSGTFACDRSLTLPQCKAMMTPGICAGVQATHNAVLGQLKGAAVLCQEAIAQRHAEGFGGHAPPRCRRPAPAHVGPAADRCCVLVGAECVAAACTTISRNSPRYLPLSCSTIVSKISCAIPGLA